MQRTRKTDADVAIGKDGARLEISVMGTLLYQRGNVRPLPMLLFYTTGGEGHGFVVDYPDGASTDGITPH